MSTTFDTPLVVSIFATALEERGPALGRMERTTWSLFAPLLKQRREGEKDGRGFIPATFKPEPGGAVRRKLENAVDRTAVVLDVETNKTTGEVPPSISETVNRIRALDIAAVVYSSHSHTAAKPRFRVVAPISRPVDKDLPAPEVIAERLGLAGVVDAGKLGIASLFYFPSAKPGELDGHETAVIEGPPIDADWLEHEADAILAAREAARERKHQEAMEAAARRREERLRQGLDPDASIIEQIRQRLDLEGILLAHGYEPKGKDRFLFPGSETGVAGVYLLRGRDGIERVYSHHSADPLAACNLPSGWSAKAIDAVDVAAILEFGGDQKAALRTLARRFGIESRPQSTRHEPPPSAGDTDGTTTAEPPPDTDTDQPDSGPDKPPRGRPFGRLTIFSVDDAETAPLRTYLLKGLISPAEISIWVGAPKCGKSFLLLYLAYMLSLGRSVFGRRVKPTRTLYIAAEGEAGIGNRIRALREKLGHSPNFHYIAQPADLLHQEGHLDDLLAAAAAVQAQLIVVDTLNRSMAGGDENSSQDMGAFIANMTRIRHETHAHIAIVHHGTKGSNGSNPRGHGSLEGADDALIEVIKNEDGSRQARVVHAKDDADGMAFTFSLDPVELGIDEDGDRVSTLIVNEMGTSTTSPDPKPKGKIDEEAATLLREIDNIVAAGQAKMDRPIPGMPLVPTFQRSVLQAALVQSGWLRLSTKLSGGLSKAESEKESIPDKEHERLWKRLNTLKLKGKIGFNRHYVWLAKA